MSDKFIFSDKHKKTLIGLAILGVLLLFGGWGLSEFEPSPDPHAAGHHEMHDGGHGGGDHGNGHDAGEDHGHSHDADHGDHDHGDAGHEDHGDAEHDSGDHEHGDEGHEDHGEDTSHDGGSHDDAHHSNASSKMLLYASVEGGGDSHNSHGHGEDEHVTITRATVYDGHTIDWEVEAEKAERGEAHLTYEKDEYGNVNVLHHGAEHGDEDHGHAVSPAKKKFGSVWLLSSFFWMAVALFGVFFIAVGYLANAGWYIVIKRILEVFYRYLPIAGAFILIMLFVFGDAIYSHWMGEAAQNDPIIAGKASFLNIGFYAANVVIFIALWTFFGNLFRKYSLREEETGGDTYHKKSITGSAIFLPLFAIGFCMAAFQWLMSIEPHWFSTIFAVYCFAGLFVSGMTVTMLITVHLKERGYLPQVTSNHLHDMGKFMFAFSVFWAYIWISQYLLIWYANIPEETIYYYNRLQDYGFLFGLNVAINFIFPFLALMTRQSKRQYSYLKSIGYVMLFGRFLDLFLIIMPGIFGGDWNMGMIIMGLGMFVLQGAIFLFVVFQGLSQAKLAAESHPFYEESLHHDTGV